MRPVGSNLPAVSIGRNGAWNYIINGDFQVNQRQPGASTNATGSATYGGYPIDRWRFYTGTGNTSTVTLTPVSQGGGVFIGTPGGASTTSYPGIYASSTLGSLHIQTSTSAVGSGGRLEYQIEDVRTLSGKTCTLSFWLYTTTGLGNYLVQFGQAFNNGGVGDNLSVNQTILSTASTKWEFFSFTFTLPNTYAVAAGSTDSSLLLRILFQAAQIYDFYITNVQLEEGPVYTGFHQRTYTEELDLCKRYYQKTFENSTLPQNGIGPGRVWHGATLIGSFYYHSWPLEKEMRKIPTLAFYRPDGGTVAGQAYNWITTTQSTAISANLLTTKRVEIIMTPPAGWAVGHIVGFQCEMKADYSD